jgi:cytochrome b561
MAACVIFGAIAVAGVEKGIKVLRNDNLRFGAVAQGFHWLTLILVLAMFGLAFIMGEIPKGPDKTALTQLHKSIGVTIFAVTLLRLLWRWAVPPPPLPDGMSDFERFAAKAVHLLLYLGLLVQASVGMLRSWSAGAPIVLFDSITLPALIAPDETLKEVFGWAHSLIAWGLLALISAHALAAIVHHVKKGDDVLLRMLPGTRGLQEKRRDRAS